MPDSNNSALSNTPLLWFSESGYNELTPTNTLNESKLAVPSGQNIQNEAMLATLKRRKEQWYSSPKPHTNPEEMHGWRKFGYYTHDIRDRSGTAKPIWDSWINKVLLHKSAHFDGVLFSDGVFAFSDDAPQHQALNDMRDKKELGRIQMQRSGEKNTPIFTVHAYTKEHLTLLTSYLKKNMTYPQIVPISIQLMRDPEKTDEDNFDEIATVLFQGKFSNFTHL